MVDQEAERVILGSSLSDDDFVFSHADGSPLNPSTVTHTFSKVARRAGLPHLRLHDLRHIHFLSYLSSLNVVKFYRNLAISDEPDV